jgi:phage shock protein A
MGILRRLSNLLRLNLHALLDRAENPERMLGQLLRDMEEDLAAARQQAAKAIAAERQLQRELDQCHAAAERWKEQARLAMSRGREDLARRAVAQKLDFDDSAGSLAVQHRAAQQLSGAVRTALATLQRRLAEARRRHALLTACKRTAQVRLDVEASLGAGLTAITAPLGRFEHLERRLSDEADELLAQADVLKLDPDLQEELDDLARANRIDEELQSLRC